jgi:glycosyltransferase involved in cell wall biosynthesis
MKILWAKCDFLHPTERGGQIRTLEMLRRIHTRHEVHYAALCGPGLPSETARCPEYSSRAYPVPHAVPRHHSPRFAAQLAAGLFSPLPVVVSRYRSRAMRRRLGELLRAETFDAMVCDFPHPAVNIPDMRGWILFQHNVETMIWQRQAEAAQDPARRYYLRLQARRMRAFEEHVCRSVRHVVTVSGADREALRRMFGLEEVSQVATGVDLDYFAPPAAPAPAADLVFVGSMDYLPNIDGVRYLAEEILPLIRARHPNCRLDLVGKDPDPAVRAAASGDPLTRVTGTVADIRPYLWGAAVSVVPLRAGGGTRLKIYESMAARVPVVSTTIGAEGLEVHPGDDIRIADSPQRFAAECIALLDDKAARKRQADAARRLVSSRYSWDRVARDFETILERESSCGASPKSGSA